MRGFRHSQSRPLRRSRRWAILPPSSGINVSASAPLATVTASNASIVCLVVEIVGIGARNQRRSRCAMLACLRQHRHLVFGYTGSNSERRSAEICGCEGVQIARRGLMSIHLKQRRRFFALIHNERAARRKAAAFAHGALGLAGFDLSFRPNAGRGRARESSRSAAWCKGAAGS